MTELRNCPFCGGEADYYGECGVVRVICMLCGANTSGWWDEPEEAVEDWNRRAEDAELQKYRQAEAEGRLVVLGKGRVCAFCQVRSDYGECYYTGYPPRPDNCADIIREAAKAALAKEGGGE